MYSNIEKQPDCIIIFSSQGLSPMLVFNIQGDLTFGIIGTKWLLSDLNICWQPELLPQHQAMPYPQS